MMKCLLVLMSTLCLAACGVETASTTATVATMKAKETQQAQETKEQAIRQLDDAQKQAEQRLKGAEEK